MTNKMTNNEAIEILHGLQDGYYPKYSEALEVGINAIKALEKEPCEDCISRRAVFEILKNNRYHFNISQEGYCEGKVLWSENLIKDDACKEIEQLPSVTPKEKTGHWIDDNENEIDAQFGKHTYKCSECGKYAEYFVSGTEVWWDRIKPNYCPNCGTKMIEPQESEVDNG